jgi:hypothetical protein
MEEARRAAARAAAGEALSAPEKRLVAYLGALGKLQRRVTGPRGSER